MKRRMVLFGSVFAGLLISCLSMLTGGTVKNDPAFSRSVWKSAKICIFPAAVHEGAHIGAKELEDSAAKYLSAEKIADFAPASKTKFMLSEKNLLDRYDALMRHYKTFKEYNDQAASEIASSLGFDFVVIVSTSSDGILNSPDTAGFTAKTRLAVIRVADKKTVSSFVSDGESSKPKPNTNPKKKANAFDVLDAIFADDTPSYPLAYERSVEKSAQLLSKMFKGECTSGDCMNGSGVYTLYGRNGNLSDDKYEGSWLNGLAHGKGVMYSYKSSQKKHSKFEGVWEKGALKKKGADLFLTDGKWAPAPNAE